MTVKYQYSAGDHPDYHEPRSRHNAPDCKIFNDDLEFVAEQCADEYHTNDGWEDRWPVEFRIYADGDEVARFKVEREYEPVFSAYAIVTDQAAA